MKDYVFNKPLPFVTEQTEKSDSKTLKYLSRGLGSVFGNDQRNVVWFALGLGIPAILLAFTGLILTSIGHPILMFFDFLLVLFVCWVFWAMYDLYKKVNENCRRHEENMAMSKKCNDCTEE